MKKLNKLLKNGKMYPLLFRNLLIGDISIYSLSYFSKMKSLKIEFSHNLIASQTIQVWNKNPLGRYQISIFSMKTHVSYIHKYTKTKL